MTRTGDITTLFVDIGGVLLTNGWDHLARRRAVERFGLNYEELDERHHLTFDTYEQGKLSLEEYLHRIVFYSKRNFSLASFRDFMFEQSQPLSEMINLIRSVKEQNGLRIVAVSNEGRELTDYRIKQFHLDKLIDFFVSSCFVHVRKPDRDIYELALDVAHVEPGQVAYIDDRPMFVDVARGLGIHGIHHTGLESTRTALASLGLTLAGAK